MKVLYSRVLYMTYNDKIRFDGYPDSLLDEIIEETRDNYESGDYTPHLRAIDFPEYSGIHRNYLRD